MFRRIMYNLRSVVLHPSEPLMCATVS
ncbi:hypothetical protein CFP56_001556 [Quercus suber]|uniref:Uncharacterized protein n=1 Tax=Quercus suber TaxID=58331 RepID=A0AAW0IMQ6_QUESU